MRKSLLIAWSCFVALWVCNVAQADDFNKAVAALKHAPVYVLAGTAGTTAETSQKLQQQTNDGDHLAIVMLPAGAISGDPEDFARRLDQELGGKRIIGLTVGDQALAYSTLLPVGVADGLMHSAQNVSTNSVETLGTFIQNVHNWQSQHPEAEASKPTAKKSNSGFPWWLILMLLATAVVAASLYFVTRPAKRDPTTGEEYIKFHSPVRNNLEELAELRSSVENQDLRVLLTQVCTDVEAYFRKYSTSADDHAVFRGHLENVCKVVRKYIEVQNDPPRYYDRPKQEILQSGYDGVEGFEHFVIDSIQRGSRAELTEFNVNTDILSAQRYS